MGGGEEGEEEGGELGEAGTLLWFEVDVRRLREVL